MKPKQDFSIIIPTYNEKDYLVNLLKSVENINYPEQCYEVIVVNDGSSDDTTEIISETFPNVNLINFETNQGRYQARKKGAETAKSENILFVDTRALVDQEILNTINQTNRKAIKGQVACGNPSNPFHVFFESIRYKIYPVFYRQRGEPFLITPQNFGKVPKGTGVFYVTRDILFEAYHELSNVKMGRIASDDVKLISKICEITPVVYHPDVKITHFIRGSFLDNFLHLIYRGSTFVFHYLDPSKRLFWLVLILPAFFLILFGMGMILANLPWFIPIFLILLLDLIMAVYLGSTLREILTISFMLPISAFAFYLGVFRGIFMKLFG